MHICYTGCVLQCVGVWFLYSLTLADTCCIPDTSFSCGTITLIQTTTEFNCRQLNLGFVVFEHEAQVEAK